ncbi:MAG: Acetylxylan esterase [Verrucomicrobiae bacterium]|nr:Acetylxylan esterase [Verrucomicrobiae bacterium]
MKPPITIVAFGDSITAAGEQTPAARWPTILWQMLQERFPDCVIEVINAGVGGNTSREGLRRIESDVLRHAPHFVLFEFGNDSTYEPDRHVDFAEFIANLNQIRIQVTQRCNGRVIPLTFPPLVDEWNQFRDHEFIRQNGGPDASMEKYRQLTRQFAREHALPLADVDNAVRAEMTLAGPAAVILPDGVHLTARGNQVVADCVGAVLSGELEKYLRAA